MSPLRRLDPFRRKITRRSFLKMAGMATAAATVGPSILRAQGGGSLRILQWSHFVPSYDTWFDQYAQAWGAANDIDVVVDHINLADLTTTVAAEISAGSGHDLIEIVGAEAGQFEPSLLDLTDVNDEATSRFGDQLEISRNYSYNPITDKFYGVCIGWTIDPANYRRSLWEAAGLPEGPSTWADLITYGGKIRDEQGVQLGIGLAQELDSNMAHRALLYSFDSMLQNEEGTIVLDEGDPFEFALEAVKYMQELYAAAMTPEVFAWNAASNNQALIAGRSSYIMNSISAYRSAQQDVPEIANDVFFGPALAGPRGSNWSNAHVIYNYVIPNHAQNIDPAKQFILDLAENYDQAMYNSKLYNSPSWFNSPVSGAGEYPAVSGASSFADLHEAWFNDDPFRLEGEPEGKLRPLLNATEWTTNVGHPGVTSPAVAEVFNTFVIPNMFARAVRGDETPEQSIRTAAGEARAVFEAWRNRGLI
ncbi:MAG TPA: ABC transporter substrate-binding protein [Trueperaceae bacterium]|nr:ABC transporter substrate-binding protein [Trueperaceae bacterium]